MAVSSDHDRARILVIKLGALGDFVHAFHAFAAIRARYPAAHITLLTTAPFQALAEASPWFDTVRIDGRPAWWDLVGLAETRRALRGFNFVFDLQTSRRSGRYYRLAGRPPWSGIARGSSHPHTNPRRDDIHTLERQQEQLIEAGIMEFPLPDRHWMQSRGSRHGLTSPYALLIPGGGGLGAVKRWPPEAFGVLAQGLSARLTVVLIGGPAEIEAARIIIGRCPAAVNLVGQTSIEDIAALAAGAVLVVGNDTGPLQLSATMGPPTLALFSAANVPRQAAPRGPALEWSTVIQVPDLSKLLPATVLAEAGRLLAEAG